MSAKKVGEGGWVYAVDTVVSQCLAMEEVRCRRPISSEDWFWGKFLEVVLAEFFGEEFSSGGLG